MDEFENKEMKPINSRRRKRTRGEIFRENYLPAIIAGVTVLLIIVMVIGSVVKGVQAKKRAEQEAIDASIAAQKEDEAQQAEAQQLVAQANTLAKQYDYQGAVNLLNTYTGDPENAELLTRTREAYQQAISQLVVWDDPGKVVNLSFQLLIADPIRAFVDESYGTSYNRNFVTTDEFRIILDQLYKNGYVLVSLRDAFQTVSLPQGKKPLVLTQTHVNYNTFMTDGDGDKLPDKDGAGFASKLILDDTGKLVNEYVDKDGNVLTGEYDLIPILNSFIASHPDFSYQGAKAVIAVTAYDGLFGYRTNPGAKERLGDVAYQQEISSAGAIASALKNDGYELACYTYENVAYGYMTAENVSADMDKWIKEAQPILGNVDIMAFAQISDISDKTPYSGEKFNKLMDAGFRYYLGFCQNGELWASVESNHVRQARILVTGSNLKYHAAWFEGILDPVQILSSLRGTIPQ